jgi:putative ABC transport system permease protein
MRSWLTVIGVFIGITAVVALISIGLGLERTITDQVSKVFGVDTFIILHEDAFGPRNHGNGGAEEYALDLAYLQSIDGVRTAAAIREDTAYVEGPSDAQGNSQMGFFQVMGLSPELATEFTSFLGELEVEPGGRLFTPDDTDVTVLGSSIAERLGVGVGDSLLVGGDDNAELHLQVIGIMAPQEDTTDSERGFSMGATGPDADTIYVPYNTMETLFGPANDVSLTLVRIQPGYDVDDVANRAEEALQARGSDITAITYTDISDAIGTVTSTVSAFLAGIAGISLLVGGVGVMNTMFTSVLERTKEIGVMKAVGAKNWHVLSIFLIESGLMGLVGGIVGTLLGLGLSGVASALISRLFDVRMAVVASPILIIVTLLGSFAIGAIAGLWPARRASKLQVVDALRYE